MILGFTGKNAGGKGEAAKYLMTRGFVYHSLSDALREVATKMGIEHSRDNLINLGNELRKKFGPDYLAKEIYKKIRVEAKDGSKNFVIDSIRSPFEATELMKGKDFILVGIDAPIELRFKRLRERNRLGDAKTLEDFKSQEQRENLKSDTNQQLDATFQMAERIIINEGSLQELYKKVNGLLKELKWQG